MKILMVNGSPNKKGNTYTALNEMRKIFEAEGAQVDWVDLGPGAVRGCADCGKCRELGKCVFDDVVNKAAPLFETCDGMVVGSPVYYASANGSLISFMDRLFFSCHTDKRMKVGASVAVARRAGTTVTMDEINKYFSISQMPIASSQYWNGVYGAADGESAFDAEGMHTVQTLAQNMVFLIRSIELGKEKYGLPAPIKKTFMNFIREDAKK